MKKFSAVALGIMFLLGCDNSPEENEKESRRDAIGCCWSTYHQKSNSEQQKRFIAKACEKMDDDFRRKYGFNP